MLLIAPGEVKSVAGNMDSPKILRAIAALWICTASITGCGGGGQLATKLPVESQEAAAVITSPSKQTTSILEKPGTDQEAARFLQQATFGFSDADIVRVKQIGYSAWIDEQVQMPVQFSNVQAINAFNPGHDVRSIALNDSIWLGIPKDDQLRQRMMFALSQIFVVSASDGSTENWGRSLAYYVDSLYAQGFGNYRDLLETVTLSPAMGAFLSHMYNQKENSQTGAVPDQNYARELMQLFSIGLYQLNQDGTPKLDSQGSKIPTYNNSDIVGVSRVLTGLAPRGATARDWEQRNCFCQRSSDILAQTSPMEANDAYHSTARKQFLGTTIPEGSTNTAADLKILLDTLFSHPNVGPFLSRQLIQRFVTSNPSADYVARVASKFNNNGNGVRGDLTAVLKAILLDPEARDPSFVNRPDYGRVREPILRMGQMMRVFKARTDRYSHTFGIGAQIYDKRKGLWQSPMRSPTVFNFYFPDYSPPNSVLRSRNLVAPELQISTVASVGDVDHLIFGVLGDGGITDCCGDEKRNTYSMRFDYSEWLPLVERPTELVEKMNTRFMAGQMSNSLKSLLLRTINETSRPITPVSGMNRGLSQVKFATAMRVMMASAEYVVQK